MDITLNENILSSTSKLKTTANWQIAGKEEQIEKPRIDYMLIAMVLLFWIITILQGLMDKF